MTARRFGPAAFSFWCGLSSLSLEILWVRLFGYAHLSSPKAFGFVLCAFLAGVALGAAAGRRQCVRHAADARRLWCVMAACTLASGLAAAALPALYAASLPAMDTRLVAFTCVAGTASLLAFCFPIAHHLGAETEGADQGRRFAAVYVSNVAGSALGPLLVGYVLLDRVTLQQAFEGVALAQAAVGAVTAWAALGRSALAARVPWVTAAAAAAAIAAWIAPADPHGLVQQVRSSEKPANAIYENRYGIVSLVPAGRIGDIVYGGNVYDGMTNTSLAVNANGLHRLALVAVLQPRPARVLMIGMSIGSWLEVVRHFPGVEHIDVIEINPAYAAAAQAYPAQREALRDPRVHLHVDDGRRWLRLHPQETYDVIVMNNTFHWRSNSTLLHSSEFLSVLRARLQPGGLLCFNATGSLDALYTASRVFPHAYRYDNFVYAAERDFRAEKDAQRALPAYLHLLGSDAANPAVVARARDLLAMPFVTQEADSAKAGRAGELITDGNMITEFRYGRPF